MVHYTVPPVADRIAEFVEAGVPESVEEIYARVREEDEPLEITSLPDEIVKQIDDAIFNCDVCNWTMPTEEEAEADEVNGGRVCLDCKDEDR